MGLIGQLLSLPYVALFFISWVVASIARPIKHISLLFLFAQPTKTIYKLKLFGLTFLYLVCCNDKKWKLPQEDPASNFPNDASAASATKIEKKTIVFVRHGESTWNDTFNKGTDRSRLSFALFFIPNLIYALMVEFYLLVAGHCEESWFFDSPLSMKGVRQATDLRSFLAKAEHTTPSEKEIIDLMTGKTKLSSEQDGAGQSSWEDDGSKRRPAAQLCSSNLRRAISTMALGFQDRLDKQMDNDSILILPQLQEISRNPDALSITPPRGEVVPSWIDKEVPGFDYRRIFSNQVDTKLHDGNKPVNTNGLKRMNEFCSIVFEQIEKDSIICGGHSLWFRSFFRTFLPHKFDHISKKKKLVNGGCAAFTLLKIKTESGDKFMIDPKSINIVHGFFG
mmetsp:Transcript_37705/g.82624  ORF Transcript_37705/g.82624 Transcript_37705/m.82624 type:complete len:394 (-) Transcript_37705:101-1282(-)